MTTTPDPEYPDPRELADDDDELDWGIQRDGRMREFADSDDAVETVPYEGND